MDLEGKGNAKQEGVEKKPQDVIGFLRQYNFGTRGESARVAVERFREYMQGIYLGGKSIREIPGSPQESFSILDLFTLNNQELCNTSKGVI